MATKETKKPVNEVGIIGQMYEERKSKKLGVLESRNEKFKTLMMRDNNGTSFTVQYSTFRSNWRKYQGEEVIQTSTQVEEAKAEEKKKESAIKKAAEKITEPETTVEKISTEEKVKRIKALEALIDSKIKAIGCELKTTRVSRGGIVVRHRKFKLFEAWIKFSNDNFEFVSRDELVNVDKKKFDSIAKETGSEYIYKEKWGLKHQYKVPKDKYEIVLDTLLELANKYAESNPDKGKVKNDKKEKN